MIGQKVFDCFGGGVENYAAVYIVQQGDTSLHKVGETLTKEKDTRLRKLQTGCPAPLSYVAFIDAYDSKADAESIESWLHEKLAPLKVEAGTAREWFDLSGFREECPAGYWSRDPEMLKWWLMLDWAARGHPDDIKRNLDRQDWEDNRGYAELPPRARPMFTRIDFQGFQEEGESDNDFSDRLNAAPQKVIVAITPDGAEWEWNGWRYVPTGRFRNYSGATR